MSEWSIPLLEIGDRKVKLIQGGMGVGISGVNLASAVANEGGAGIIASVGLGAGLFFELLKEHADRLRKASCLEEKMNIRNELYALGNQIALRETIRETRRRTNGVVGVNNMYALSDFPTLFDATIEEKADLMIVGAGVMRNVQQYLKGRETKTQIGVIVNSAKGADFICRTSTYPGYPAFFIVEGPKAGGHLGYSYKELANPEFIEHGLEIRFKEVLGVAKSYEQKFERKIPVIAAGGIFYGADIRRFLDLGASGVQMATRFVTTEECDADIRFKQAYINCGKGDLRIITSPVGMPGRAIRNSFLEAVEAGKKVPVNCPYHCLKTCKPDDSPYCIARALVDARAGLFEEGFVFAGSNAYLCDHIGTVHQVFEALNREYSAAA